MIPSEQNNNWLIPGAILIGFLFIAIAIYFGSGDKQPQRTNVTTLSSTQAKHTIRPVDSTDFIRGNPNAPILIVEYSDYDCPFCKVFHDTMNQIIEEYGPGGRVAWVYRQFPLSALHPSSPRISLSALCVGELGGNEAFWRYTDIIFQERNLSEPTNIVLLPDYAERVGVSRAELLRCLESNRHVEVLAASAEDGIRANFESTPYSFILVGDKIEPILGAQSPEIMRSIIDSLLRQLDGFE